MIHHNQEIKQLKCPLADEWINKMEYIYIYGEYYSELRRKEIQLHATT